MENSELPSIYSHPDINFVAEYVKDKLYFAVLVHDKREPRKTTNTNFFSIDDKLVYNNFYNDFGPLNLACVYKYCWKVDKKLHNRRRIVHYTTQDDRKKANAAYLIASYAIICLNKSPRDAFKPLIESNNQYLRPFQDASSGISLYNIRLQDCLNALYKATCFGFFNFDDFDLSEYEKYEKLKNGDLNWIIPEKFLAFIGPSTQPGSAYHPPEHYYNYFLQNGVTAIVRLNKESYDSQRFTRLGIRHYDMFMPDGSVPPRKILNQFLHLAESTMGPIAVHCKAGLGRTGSLIGAYLMKHYKMTAKEAIAWTRICRPGSVIGHQQAWLESMQKELWHAGLQHRLKYHGDIDHIMHHKYGIYSVENKFSRKYNFVLPNDYLFLIKQSKDCASDDKRAIKHEERVSSNDREARKIESPFTNSFTKPAIINIFARKFKSSAGQSSSRKLSSTDIYESQGDQMNRIKAKRNFQNQKIS